MATWDDGMSLDIGSTSVNTATLTLQGMSPDIGSTSVNTATLTLQGMSPDIGNLSLLQVIFEVNEIDLVSILPAEDVVFEPGIIGINEINVVTVEDVVVHFVYTGTNEITIDTPSEPVVDWKYIGTNEISIAPVSVVVPEWVYSQATQIEIDTPSIVLLYSGKPYLIRAALQIDGADYSGDLFGAVNVNMSDGSATTFSFSLYSPLIPSDFVDKEVTISYQAADGDGLVSGVNTLVVGRIREARINVDSPTLIEISGYDYAGYHNELGQLYSGDITRILSGTIGVTGAGALNTGKAPIFNVAYVETAIAEVEDGKDYFVDALSGIIYIPVSSKLLTASASLSFQYIDPFTSFDELAQHIASLKGWTISNDGFTVSDYTEPKKQPIISLSNEGIVDTLKKLYEIGGGKLDSSLYPDMRVYCDRVNYDGNTLHTFIESDIVFDSLSMYCSLFDVLTDQTVKSVQNTYSNVEVSAPVEVENQSGQVLPNSWQYVPSSGLFFTSSAASKYLAYEQAMQIQSSMGATDIFTITIPMENVNEYTFIPGGSPSSYPAIYYNYNYDGGTFVIHQQDVFYKNSVIGEWRTEEDRINNVVNFILSNKPVIDEIYGTYTSYPEGYVGAFVVYFRRVDWQISISTTKLNYGEGVATSQVEVSGTQAVQKIDIKLEGDVYEQAFLETQTQAEDLCKAILHERKFIYNASATIPLHKIGDVKLGDKTEILSRGKSVVGNLKNISYNIDTENGSGLVAIDVKGFGTGI